MPMTNYKVPPNYKPTAAVVKANPTVKQYTTGQIIKVPNGSNVPVRQANYSNYVNAAFAGTPPKAGANAGVMDSYNYQRSVGANMASNYGTGSFIGSGGTAVRGVYGAVNRAAATPLTGSFLAAGGSAVLGQNGAIWNPTSTGGGGYGGGYGGGGGGGSNPIVSAGIGNDVNVSLNWRIG